MSTLQRYVQNPVSVDELRKMITENWSQLSVTIEFWPGPGRRIRGATSERRYVLRSDDGHVLLISDMESTARGVAGAGRMASDLREVFGETPLPDDLGWEDLSEFAHLADTRTFEIDGGGKPPKDAAATYRLSEIAELLRKRRAAPAGDGSAETVA